MKTLLYLIVPLVLTACNKDCESCNPLDYREEMRNLVTEISQYGRNQNPAFIVIPQNGIELITKNDLPDGELSTTYLNAIDGHGQEDLFFGYNSDNRATPENTTNYLSEYLHNSAAEGKTILVTDYCDGQDNIDESYQLSAEKNFISFAANERDLSAIPPYPAVPNNVNDQTINMLSEAKNFLYLLNQKNYPEHDDFIEAVISTNYDMLIMDLYGEDDISFTASEIQQLKLKANGGSRLVICYFSIGEAEDYRFYWQSAWKNNPPEWLGKENPNWTGNYKVRYWYDDWKKILLGQEDSYLDKIMAAGFDGVYLDIIDAFEYWE